MPIIKNIKAKEPIIMSIGGSMIVPDGGPNVHFLTELDKFVRKMVKRGYKLVLVTGGGKTARHYIDAASKIHEITDEDLDWLGIHSTRLNAQLLRTFLRDIANPTVVKNPNNAPKKMTHAVQIAAGWKPGWSTDYVASRIAKRLGSSLVINMSNIDHVYDSDPRHNKNAKPFELISWKGYRAMVGDEWNPGLSAPFDPIASKFCHQNKIKVAIVSGDLANTGQIIAGKRFEGTIIE
jgi:uridylate kinase